jgi:hypothetical protein
MEQTEKEAAFDQLVAETNATNDAEQAKPVFIESPEADLKRFEWVVELLTMNPVLTESDVGERASALQAALDLGFEKRQAIDVAMSLRMPTGVQTIDGTCETVAEEDGQPAEPEPVQVS